MSKINNWICVTSSYKNIKSLRLIGYVVFDVSVAWFGAGILLQTVERGERRPADISRTVTVSPAPAAWVYRCRRQRVNISHVRNVQFTDEWKKLQKQKKYHVLNTSNLHKW